MPDPRSPGQQFVDAYGKDGDRAEVTYDFTITEAFQPTKERPRLTVRNLFPIKDTPLDSLTHWRESHPSREQAGRVNEAQLRREAAFRFGMADAKVHPIQGWIQVPPELTADPVEFARFIDYRLLVRLATAENQALTLGPHGVLSHPDINHLEYRGEYQSAIMAGANEIEQTGATAHAMIVNPVDYYFHLMGKGSLLADLAGNGTKIVRTRMVAPGCALMGDFAVAAQLLDGGRSVIKVAQPPDGTFVEPGLAVCAEVYEGLAIHLPTHFFHVCPA
jgi:hypothetical protein